MHQKNQAQKLSNLSCHDTRHTKNDTRRKKNDLSGLGLDPRIVVETGEKRLSFALHSSQFLKYLQGNFQKIDFYSDALAQYC